MKEHEAKLTMDDYRPAPFWFLNHRLEKTELLLQLKLMGQQGIKAFYPEYILRRWWETGVIQEDRALDKLRDYVVTCHIHDNNGYRDQHGMPFDGTINWRELMPKLFDCPRMIDFQTEVVLEDGKNWAGPLLAPAGGYSIRRLVDTFRYLGFCS